MLPLFVMQSPRRLISSRPERTCVHPNAHRDSRMRPTSCQLPSMLTWELYLSSTGPPGRLSLGVESWICCELYVQSGHSRLHPHVCPPARHFFSNPAQRAITYTGTLQIQIKCDLDATSRRPRLLRHVQQKAPKYRTRGHSPQRGFHKFTITGSNQCRETGCRPINYRGIEHFVRYAKPSVHTDFIRGSGPFQLQFHSIRLMTCQSKCCMCTQPQPQTHNIELIVTLAESPTTAFSCQVGR